MNRRNCIRLLAGSVATIAGMTILGRNGPASVELPPSGDVTLKVRTKRLEWGSNSWVEISSGSRIRI
jgi:hypothetical protein